MKHLLLTTIAAVVLVGCGPSGAEKSLIDAAGSGNIEAVKQAIADGANVEVKNVFSITPLHFASAKGHKEIAELLIAKGAEVNAKNVGGETPLDSAAYWGHKEVAKLLISRGADVNAVIESGGLKGKTPLGLAWRHHPEVTDFLRKHGGKTGAWLNAYNSIHAAARAGHIKAVKQHLASGADVNAKTMSGFTPLDATSVFNKTETADLLRKHGGKTKMELKAEGK